MADSKIPVGNGPCSWGTLEFEGLEGERITYTRMLDELVETGYQGTELGDWGFMPTEPAALQAELDRRHVELWGDFIAVKLDDPAAHDEGEARVVEIAQLMAAVTQGRPRQPFVVLAYENGSDPVRTSHAGCVTDEMMLSESGWQTFAQGVERIARAVREQTGLRTVFHHHCAGYIETPAEIAKLLELTDPDLLGLVFDTGHYVFGAGADGCHQLMADLDRFADRIWYMHFKDCHAELAAQSRHRGWDYFESVRQGVFCELGQGCVDFPAVLAWLENRHYTGGILVEQDVLPGMGNPKESARRNRDYLASIGL
ncbi:MAG: TIM barrel protein [Chloroflexota bacterium]